MTASFHYEGKFALIKLVQPCTFSLKFLYQAKKGNRWLSISALKQIQIFCVTGWSFCSNVITPYFRIISLRGEVWAHKTSLIWHIFVLLLKFLYQDKKQSHRFCLILLFFDWILELVFCFHFIIARNFNLLFLFDLNYLKKKPEFATSLIFHSSWHS